jgi:hypothetical protein
LAVLGLIFFQAAQTMAQTSGSLVIVSPSGGSTVSGSVTVSVTSTLSLNNDWWNSLAVDGVSAGLNDSGHYQKIIWNSATVANGTHTLTVTAHQMTTGAVTATASVSVIVGTGLPTPSPTATSTPGSGSQNPIQIENANAGTANWLLTNAASANEIAGYANLTSVNKGGQIEFFVTTPDLSYSLSVYRMGYYEGLGGRLMFGPVTGIQATNQTIPTPDPTTGFLECNWVNPYLLTTGSNWTSGVYLAKLTASSTGKQSYIIFVVRDDSSSSDLLFQQSTNTYQAYNNWGGKSLYAFNSSSTPTINSTAAVMVSYNRPYSAKNFGAGDFFSWEFNMLAFLESQGYDVTYTTDVDTHTSPSLILNHKGFLIVGHDEYWSWEMRQNVTAARDARVNLGWFSANECFWQIRYQSSELTGSANRTVVAYKEDAAQDPDAANPSTNYLITTKWRLLHGSYPATPEDALIGQMSIDFEPVSAAIAIGDIANWVFDNSGLQNGDTLAGLLGYEVEAVDSGSPPGTITLTSSPFQVAGIQGTHFGDMSLYQANSGAWVFSTGSMDWTCGLSDVSPNSPSPSRVNPAAQQITFNVLNQFIGSSSATPTPSVTSTATPTATPTPNPTPTSTATATTTPTAAPTPTRTATPTTAPTLTPTPIPTATPTTAPTSTPTPIPTATPSTTPTSIPTPTPTATSTPIAGSLVIVSPSNGSTVSSSVTVSVTSTLSLNNDWWNSLAVDGVSAGLNDSGHYQKIIWNSATLANGTHTLTVMAHQVTIGTVTATATVGVTVAN